MPYIKDCREGLRPLSSRPALNEGELNFQITSLLVDYLQAHGLSYERIGDIKGALDNAADEFYRRIAAPYEDAKIAENGDVYPKWLLVAAERGTHQ